MKNVQNFFSCIISLWDRACVWRDIVWRWFLGHPLKMKIYWIILKLVLLTHWCSGFDQISLDRNIFIKKREKKCCIPIFGEIFWEILELLWLMGVLGVSETPSTKNKVFLHMYEKKKCSGFFPQWVISILGLSAKKNC